MIFHYSIRNQLLYLKLLLILTLLYQLIDLKKTSLGHSTHVWINFNMSNTLHDHNFVEQEGCAFFVELECESLPLL